MLRLPPAALLPAALLPAPLLRRVDAAAAGFLQVGGEFDFSSPPGEAALVPPESVSWRVFKCPLALFIGGVTAVLLELGEPRVRDGVWQHSSFRSDAMKRLQRTGLAAMVTVYGPRSRAEAMIAGVAALHGRVVGVTSEGEPYRADDPALLDWVQATASFGFMEAYHRYVHRLGARERDALLAEGRVAALLYGATGAPASQAALDALFEAQRGRLMPSPILAEFLAIMEEVPVLPGPARPLQRLLLKAAVSILPGWVRDRLELDARWSLTGWQRRLVRSLARGSDRLLLPSSPAVQSCRRLGLPDDYLFRRPARRR